MPASTSTSRPVIHTFRTSQETAMLDPKPSPNNTPAHALSPQRRTLLKAASWGAPAIVMASAAPAFASSNPTCADYAGGTKTWETFEPGATFLIPEDGCVSQLTFDIAGGGGGGWGEGGSGGSGHRITGTIDLGMVPPGTLLYLVVGQGGEDAAGGEGYGYGGAASTTNGGGGGGGTAILFSDGTPLAVAGGGGGAGGSSTTVPGNLKTPPVFESTPLPADNPPQVRVNGTQAVAGGGVGVPVAATGIYLTMSQGLGRDLTEGGATYAHIGAGRPAQAANGGRGAVTWAFWPPAHPTFTNRIGYGTDGGNFGGVNGGGDGGRGGQLFSGASIGAGGGGGGYAGGGGGLTVSGSLNTVRHPTGEFTQIATGGGGGSSWLAAPASELSSTRADNGSQRGWITLAWS